MTSREKLEVLERRLAYLRDRISAARSHGTDLSYDKAEASALEWAVATLRPIAYDQDYSELIALLLCRQACSTSEYLRRKAK